MADRVTHKEVYDFIAARRLALIASIGPQGEPQSARVGFAVSLALEIVLDTVTSSRKYPNLKHDPHIAIVFGWESETAVQSEGLAIEPEGGDLDRAKSIYFSAWRRGVNPNNGLTSPIF